MAAPAPELRPGHAPGRGAGAAPGATGGQGLGRPWGRFSLRRLTFPIAELLLVGADCALASWLARQATVFPEESYVYLARARALAERGWPAVPWNGGMDPVLPWGYPLALALPVRLFGDNGAWMLAVLLIGWTALVGDRLLACLGASPAVRMGAVALALFNPVALRWSTLPAPEPLLVALAVTSVYFGFRFHQGASGRELLWASGFAGLALLTRAEGIFVAAAVAALALPRLRRERRAMLALTAALAIAAPAGLRLGYLVWTGVSVPEPLEWAEALRKHLVERPLADTLVEQIRAPFWMAYRYHVEPWLYARYFPGWLPVAQGLVLVLYLALLGVGLLSGFFARSWAFFAAMGLLAFAGVSALWPPVSERTAALAVPAAAFVFCWSSEALLSWLQRRGARRALVLGLALAAAAVSGLYGARGALLQAAQLESRAGHRDYRALAETVNANNLEARPVVTDLGPALAYHLAGPVYFSAAVQDLVEDVVPRGASGRAFLEEKRVAIIVSSRPERELEREFALSPEAYEQIDAPGATVLRLRAWE